MRALLAPALAVLLAAAGGCGEEPARATRTQGQATAPAPAPAPPPRSEAELTVAHGEALFFGKGGCHTCHSVGDRGQQLVGPNLGVAKDFPKPFAARAAARRPGLTPLEYALESLVDPDAYVVATYAPGVMKRPELPPISLSDADLVAVAAYVASIGAERQSSAAELASARESLPGLRAARARRVAAKRP